MHEQRIGFSGGSRMRPFISLSRGWHVGLGPRVINQLQKKKRKMLSSPVYMVIDRYKLHVLLEVIPQLCWRQVATGWMGQVMLYSVLHVL